MHSYVPMRDSAITMESTKARGQFVRRMSVAQTGDDDEFRSVHVDNPVVDMRHQTWQDHRFDAHTRREVKASTDRHLGYLLAFDFALDDGCSELFVEIERHSLLWQSKTPSDTDATHFIRDKAIEFILATNQVEGTGTQDLASTREALERRDTDAPRKKETLRLEMAMQHLHKSYLQQADEEDCRKSALPLFLHSSDVVETHRLLYPKDDWAGQLRTQTTAPLTSGDGTGGDHYYPDGAYVTTRLDALLDAVSDHVISCGVTPSSPFRDRAELCFRVAGFLLFFILDLHPFCDGNGRLARLLANRALMPLHPFPVPVHSDKQRYLGAIFHCRNNGTPAALTKLLLQSSARAWIDAAQVVEGAPLPTVCIQLTLPRRRLEDRLSSQIALSNCPYNSRPAVCDAVRKWASEPFHTTVHKVEGVVEGVHVTVVFQQ